MVKSMTGFGRGHASTASHGLTVEISTVNRKQFDAAYWLPREWMAFEIRLNALLRSEISRGSVKCTVTVKPLAEAGDGAGLAQKFLKLKTAAERLGVRCEPTLSDLIALSASDEAAAVPEPDETVWNALEAAVREALRGLQSMRLHEGERIAADIRSRLGRLYGMYETIHTIAPELPALYRDALQARIAELMPSGQGLDGIELEREVAIFAEKCDIAEELTRLKAHFEHAETLLSGEAPCGRPLDFLCQEFFREINTTGSKCNSERIAHTVIEFKTLLETVREQVQNLE